MSNDKNIIKPTSLRLSEEDIAKFKTYADELNLNQAQAFNSLISLAELEKAKSTLTDRAKAIDVFRDTVNSLVNFYINALEENNRAEETIKQDFIKQLDTKDNTIVDLQEKNQKLIQELQEIKELQEQNIKAINNYVKDIDSLNKIIIDKDKQLDTLENNNSMLQENLTEYKQYKTDYKTLEEQLKALQEQLNKSNADYKETLSKAKEENLIKSNRVKTLEEQFKNSNDTMLFYKKEIELKNIDITELKAEIKQLKEEHKKEIAELKAEHKEEVLKLEAEHKKELDNLSNKATETPAPKKQERR